MAQIEGKIHDRRRLSRRTFLGTTAGAMTLRVSPLLAAPAILSPRPPLAPALDDRLRDALAKHPYLTPLGNFGGFVRERPAPFELPPDRLRALGLDRQTWRLEVVPDEGGKEQVQRPLSESAGTTLTFADLLKLGETRAVRFIKTLACTLVSDPFGTGIWEGVALRDVIWLAGPSANVRRVYYYGFHNDDPKQKFQSSLPLSRVLEEPPGELPVILCYKYNGQWLTPKLGGPVRMIVPEGYGNKCIKWLRRVVLTNNYQANDTYAAWGNDTDSPVKTCARFIQPSHKIKLAAGQALAVVGSALVGGSGLGKVQYSLHPHGAPLPADDPYLTKLDWRDAQILPPPEDWGGDLPGGKLPRMPLQFDEALGEMKSIPRSWPLRYASAQWAAMTSALTAGRYLLRCRTIDGNGHAQPMPRPLPRTGDNLIQEIEVGVV
jgi:DMSO/TMAO reductase YedYZ molybdopterin-dependent catalytic subunit